MAGQRKPWESLSEAYRERLQRQGITPREHAAGGSLKAGRGHGKTPEHISEGIAHPEKYPEWFNKRSALVARVARRKEQLFGRAARWNGRRSKKIVDTGADGSHPPSNARLRWALEASDDEIMAALESRDLDDSFLFYH